MNISTQKVFQRTPAFALSFALAASIAAAAPVALAQTDATQTSSQSGNSSTTTNTTSTNTTSPSPDAKARSIANGQKVKLTGVVTRRDADTFTVRDLSGVETTVRLNDATRVTERKSNPFRRAKNYGVTNILRGLNVEVEGRGDAAGQLLADSVKFSDQEFRVARSIESRVDPVENRVGASEARIGANETRLGQVEQNAQRLSGQLDELAAVSNAARGGAKAAQETADAAVAGVNLTNQRISALDDYVAQQTAVVNFRTGSTRLSPEARAALDDLATKAFNAKGYVIEVAGFTDSTGNLAVNRRLSQERADAVVRYLAEQHRIPLRRIITPFGYGQSQAVADNRTRDGRARNRRVEVRMLVNRGLTQQAPAANTTSSANSPALP